VALLASSSFSVVLAVAIPTLAASPDDGPDIGSPQSTELLQQRVAEMQQQQQGHQQWLQTGTAEQQRVSSETAFDSLNGAEASDLLERKFGDQLATTQALDPDQIGRFANDYAAQVGGAVATQAAAPSPDQIPIGRPMSIPLDQHPGDEVVSNVPLRARDDTGLKEPTDLSLENQGNALEPANPVVDTELPDNLGRDFHLDGNGGLDIALAGATNASATRVGETGVLYPNAQTDTDLLVSAQPTGVELSTQLRSPESPQTERLTLQLPPGAELREEQGGFVSIIDGDETLGLVHPPTASDAQGQEIPVSLSAEGDTLVIKASYDDPNVAFPILVDPQIDWYTWQSGSTSYNAWWSLLYGNAPTTTFCPGGTASLCNGQSGLAIWYAPSYGAATGGSAANWVYNAPRYFPGNASSTSAWISSASFQNIGYSSWGSAYNYDPYLIAGIWNAAASNWTGQGAIGSAATNGTISTTAGSVAGVPVSGGKQLIFGLSRAGLNTPGFRVTTLGTVYVSLTDPDTPTLSYTSNTSPSDWVDSATGSFDATAIDGTSSTPGLGIQSLDLSYWANGQLQHDQHPTNCVGGQATGVCPASATQHFSYSTAGMPEGFDILYLNATDPAGHVGQTQQAEIVDHSNPAAQVSGSLRSGTGLDLSVQATDGSANSSTPNTWRSGMKSIELLVDGQRAAVTTGGTNGHGYVQQGCTAWMWSCGMTANFTLDRSQYVTGDHSFSAIVTDQLGHQRTEQWTAPIDNTPPDTLIDSGPSGPTQASSPHFTYEATEPGSTFQCSRDGAAFAGCGASGYTAAGLSEGTHTFAVRAIDAAGNVDQTPGSSTFVVDFTAPLLNASGPLVDSTNPLIGLNPATGIDATDAGTGVTLARFTVDGQVVDEIPQSCVNGSCELQETLSGDLSNLSAGTHSFVISAIDAAGNSTTRSGTFNLDPTPPSIAASGPLVDAEGANLPSSTAGLDVQATDGIAGDTGVSSVKISVDDTQVVSTNLACQPGCPADTNASYTYDENDWDVGPHLVAITVTDAAGNIARRAISVNDPPSTDPTIPACTSAGGPPAGATGDVESLDDGGELVSYAGPAGTTVVFPQPPAGFDPETATDDELSVYGFPPRPTDPNLLGRWHEDVGSVQEVAPPDACQAPEQVDPEPPVAGDLVTSKHWAGFADLNPKGNNQWAGIQGDYSQPNHTTTCPGGQEVSWIGLGGYGTGSLIQAGTGIDAGDNLYAWFEYLKPGRQFPIQRTGLAVHPGDHIHIWVNYVYSNNYANLYVTDLTTGRSSNNIVFALGHKYYDGSSAEFIDERPSLTVNGSFTSLENFGTTNWSQARSMTTGGGWGTLSSFNHVRINMQASHLLASPSALTSSTSFSDHWVAC
jgi:hypothetical protein